MVPDQDIPNQSRSGFPKFITSWNPRPAPPSSSNCGKWRESACPVPSWSDSRLMFLSVAQNVNIAVSLHVFQLSLRAEGRHQGALCWLRLKWGNSLWMQGNRKWFVHVHTTGLGPCIKYIRLFTELQSQSQLNFRLHYKFLVCQEYTLL